jgi:hypothetical protein
MEMSYALPDKSLFNMKQAMKNHTYVEEANVSRQKLPR